MARTCCKPSRPHDLQRDDPRASPLPANASTSSQTHARCRTRNDRMRASTHRILARGRDRNRRLHAARSASHAPLETQGGLALPDLPKPGVRPPELLRIRPRFLRLPFLPRFGPEHALVDLVVVLLHRLVQGSRRNVPHTTTSPDAGSLTMPTGKTARPAGLHRPSPLPFMRHGLRPAEGAFRHADHASAGHSPEDARYPPPE